MASYGLVSFACLFLVCAAQNVTHGRLPPTMKPKSYVITLNTDLDNFNFSGSVSVTFRATQPTNSLTLHLKDLALTALRIDGGVTISGFDTSTETETVEIRVNSSFIVGRDYVLVAEYVGVLGDKNVGFYRASYVDENKITRYMAVAQLAATHARRAFPCFDQPDMKATFRIILIRDAKYVTTSNTYIESTQPYALDPSKMVDTYAITPIMATYIVAFTVSDFSRVSANTYAVYGRKELLDRGDGAYALTIGRGAINAMAAYTSVNYTLLHLDQVAIPNDYNEFVAMENWGMITYKEKKLLYNKETSAAAERQGITRMIAHEIAHQWFGNLVTPYWWKWVWLNEGFATYFEIVVSNQLEPDYKLMDQFTIGVMQLALEGDALLSTTSMTRDVETPSEIRSLFDIIVYEKAGSVIKMMASLLGERVFQAGLTAYLREWGLKNVEPANLYGSWQTALNNNAINVSQIMTSWETQKGFPVVTVKRNYSDGTINLRQARFLLNTNVTDDTTKWFIPINWFSPTVPVNSYRILAEDENLNSGVPTEDWLIANYNREGYYRVNYDEDNWKLIVSELVQNLTQIPVRNRAQLVDDSFNLARAGLVNYKVAFDLGKYIVNEKEYVPIATFTNALGYLHRITTGTSHNTYIKKYGLEILEKIYNRTGFDISPDDTHLQKLLKVNLMTWLCNFGHEECLAKSLRAYQSWLNDGVEVQPDAQSFVYCSALKDSSTSWSDLFSAYFRSTEVFQRSRIASALGCTRSHTFLQLSLDFVRNEGVGFSANDREELIASIYSNNGENGGESIILHFLTNYYDAISPRLDSVTRIVQELGDRINNEKLLQQFKDFAQANQKYFSDSFKSIVTTAIETAEYNLRWIGSVSPQFESYFATTTPTGDDGGASLSPVKHLS